MSTPFFGEPGGDYYCRECHVVPVFNKKGICSYCNAKPRAYVYSFESSWNCASCHQPLGRLGKGPLVHPTHTGWLRKRPSTCPFAGKRFKVPTVGLEEA